MQKLKVKLEGVIKQLERITDLKEKHVVLDQDPDVQKFLNDNPSWLKTIEDLSDEEIFVLKAVLALGEGAVVFYGWESVEHKEQALARLANVLIGVDAFYDSMGGVIGYHLEVLNLLIHSGSEEEKGEKFSKPPGLNLSENSTYVDQAVIEGIKTLSLVGEIFPIGGAGDRLNLRDEESGVPLPAAVLPYNGRTLLEGLIRDVWAKEYLHYKLYGSQVRIPIALMTSYEKDNHSLVKGVCIDSKWFGRGKQGFTFFTQPLVPVITVEGHWSMASPLSPSLKPGGHGVMWKLALDKGVFDWMADHGARKALVRQINNPVAGTDGALLAFTGMGVNQDKTFGFASCYRVVGTAEGVNVVVEAKKQDEYAYTITNIEYTEFKKKGIEDTPDHSDSNYSKFPANTNILFIDLPKVKEKAKTCPVPGKLINMKSYFPYTDPNGETREVKGGRLESTMQNIADEFVDVSSEPLQETQLESLGTYVTYNTRRKTISVTKKSYQKGDAILETPVGCFYEQQSNHHELLTKYCGFETPSFCDEEEYLRNGPTTLFLFHPALGPIWSVIGQKIQGGRLAKGAELQLEVADVAISNLDLQGSLIVDANRVVGKTDSEGIVRCDDSGGKCLLKDVVVRNGGIDRGADNVYWKNEIYRMESLQINLHGNSEFVAEGVTFEGDYLVDVPDGSRVTAAMEDGEVVFRKEEIVRKSWTWKYTANDEGVITLSR